MVKRVMIRLLNTQTLVIVLKIMFHGFSTIVLRVLLFLRSILMPLGWKAKDIVLKRIMSTRFVLSIISIIVKQKKFKSMTAVTQAAKVEQARGLAKWFKLEITLSIFDHVIFHWVYPPQKSAK